MCVINFSDDGDDDDDDDDACTECPWIQASENKCLLYLSVAFSACVEGMLRVTQLK